MSKRIVLELGEVESRVVWLALRQYGIDNIGKRGGSIATNIMKVIDKEREHE